MGVVELAQVLRLGRIGRANLPGLDRQERLSQATAIDQFIDLVWGQNGRDTAGAAWYSHDGALSDTSRGLKALGSDRLATMVNAEGALTATSSKWSDAEDRQVQMHNRRGALPSDDWHCGATARRISGLWRCCAVLSGIGRSCRVVSMIETILDGDVQHYPTHTYQDAAAWHLQSFPSPWEDVNREGWRARGCLRISESRRVLVPEPTGLGISGTGIASVSRTAYVMTARLGIAGPRVRVPVLLAAHDGLVHFGPSVVVVVLGVLVLVLVHSACASLSNVALLLRLSIFRQKAAKTWAIDSPKPLRSASRRLSTQ